MELQCRLAHGPRAGRLLGEPEEPISAERGPCVPEEAAAPRIWGSPGPIQRPSGQGRIKGFSAMFQDKAVKSERQTSITLVLSLGGVC